MDKVIDFSAYCSVVSLDSAQPPTNPITPPLDSQWHEKVLSNTALYLFREYHQNNHLNTSHYSIEQQIDELDSEEKENLINKVLTVRYPTDTSLPQDILSNIDYILQKRLELKGVNESTAIPTIQSLFLGSNPKSEPSPSLPSFFSRVKLWKGDITTLKVDCIVNACNDKLLGCFRPNHPCIDNAIHTQAGPQLRDDCYKIMMMQNHSEPEGYAKITRAYNLPSSYVIHTVGPSLNRGEDVTPLHDELLSNCYISSLNLASKFPVKTIAFCCISTGVFGFPQNRAVKIAIDTVKEWLESEDARKSSIQEVVFNVFLKSDEELYISEFENISGCKLTSNIIQNKKHPDWIPITISPLPLSSTVRKNLGLALQWLKSCDKILISGGAGLSAATGLDYTDEVMFKKHFPALHKKGHKCFYEFFGKRDWTPAQQWGYLFAQANLARFLWPRSTLYAKLKAIVENLNNNNNNNNNNSNINNNNNNNNVILNPNYFVVTSNADGMFSQNGFPPELVFTTQGDYSIIQCMKPCSSAVWATKDYIEKALPFIDENTQELTNPLFIPSCPNCKGEMFFNVRGGDWFLESPHNDHKKRYKEWVNTNVTQIDQREGRFFVILEIGAGFNTPSVLRFPNEQLVSKSRNVRLIRINLQHPEVGDLQGKKAVGISLDAGEAIYYLFQNLDLTD